MSREAIGTGELEFLQALMKRGFVTIPRILFDYTADLGLDYDAIGKIFALMACIGGPSEIAFGLHSISRRANAHDFDQLRSLICDLEEEELVLSEDEGDKITFSFVPLFSRLRAIWEQYKEHYENELGDNLADPALVAAEHLLGRPLSDREVVDIQDWMTTYDFDSSLIQAVIREGQRQGVTRMTYLNQIAKQWFEEGVRTPEDAERYVQHYRKAAGKHKAIVQYLGLNRQLTGAEQSLLDKWSDEWGFSNEVIIRACAEATGSKNPLQYINRVLESWTEQGVRTVAEAEQLMAEYKRKAVPETTAHTERKRKPTSRSNVFLDRDKKDDPYYDHIYKKFGE